MKGLTATMGMMTYGERLMGAGRVGSSTSDAWKGRQCYLHSGRAHASGAITRGRGFDSHQMLAF